MPSPWVPVAERLPELRRRVYVRGEHTPPGRGAAYARRATVSGRADDPDWIWSSPWWRATVGVTHWLDWPGEPPDAA
jgi:hypothetical protein